MSPYPGAFDLQCIPLTEELLIPLLGRELWTAVEAAFIIAGDCFPPDPALERIFRYNKDAFPNQHGMFRALEQSIQTGRFKPRIWSGDLEDMADEPRHWLQWSSGRGVQRAQELLVKLNETHAPDESSSDGASQKALRAQVNLYSAAQAETCEITRQRHETGSPEDEKSNAEKDPGFKVAREFLNRDPGLPISYVVEFKTVKKLRKVSAKTLMKRLQKDDGVSKRIEGRVSNERREALKRRWAQEWMGD